MPPACVYENSGHLASISQVKVLFSLALAAFLSMESNSQTLTGEERGTHDNSTGHSGKCSPLGVERACWDFGGWGGHPIKSKQISRDSKGGYSDPNPKVEV